MCKLEERGEGEENAFVEIYQPFQSRIHPEIDKYGRHVAIGGYIRRYQNYLTVYFIIIIMYENRQQK